MDKTPYDFAEERTGLSQDRTLLANERTFASWMRTALGAVAVGLGFNVLFRAVEPLWVPKALATSFIAIGIFVLWAAERRACRVQERMEPHEVKLFRRRRIMLIAYTTILACIGVIAAIWILV